MKQTITIDPFVVSTAIPSVPLRRGEEVDISISFESQLEEINTFTLTGKTLNFYWATMADASLGSYWNKPDAVSLDGDSGKKLLVHFNTNTMANDASDFICFVRVSSVNEIFYRGVFIVSLFASPGGLPAVIDGPTTTVGTALSSLFNNFTNLSNDPSIDEIVEKLSTLINKIKGE